MVLFELLDQTFPEVRHISGLSNHVSQYIFLFHLNQFELEFVSVMI